MVPALLEEHQHHERAISAINHYLARGYDMLLVGHALFETYSSMTRMPSPSRTDPDLALEGIERTFIGRGTIITLSPDEYETVLQEFVAAGVVGGSVYDASIVACARARGADVILTFNERHFRPFEGNGLTIIVP